MTSCGSIPSTVQPTDWAVPRISFMQPENSRDMERGLITLAALMISSLVMLPLCLMFFTFFLSLGGSFKALMMRAAAEGTTVTVACLFWTFNWTVTFRQATVTVVPSAAVTVTFNWTVTFRQATVTVVPS